MNAIAKMTRGKRFTIVTPHETTLVRASPRDCSQSRPSLGRYGLTDEHQSERSVMVLQKPFQPDSDAFGQSLLHNFRFRRGVATHGSRATWPRSTAARGGE